MKWARCRLSNYKFPLRLVISWHPTLLRSGYTSSYASLNETYDSWRNSPSSAMTSATVPVDLRPIGSLPLPHRQPCVTREMHDQASFSKCVSILLAESTFWECVRREKILKLMHLYYKKDTGNSTSVKEQSLEKVRAFLVHFLIKCWVLILRISYTFRFKISVKNVRYTRHSYTSAKTKNL